MFKKVIFHIPRVAGDAYLSLTENVLPHVTQKTYFFLAGVSALLSVFSAISPYLAFLSMSIALAWFVPAVFVCGLAMSYYLSKQQKKYLKELESMQKSIDSLREKNNELQAQVDQLICRFKVFYQLNLTTPPEQESDVTKLKILKVSKRLYLKSGNIIGQKPSERDFSTFMQKATSIFLRFALDVGLSFGACYFILTVALSVPFFGVPLVGTLVGSLVMGVMAYFFVHRKNALRELKLKAMQSELRRQQELNGLYTDTLADLRDHMQANDKINEDIDMNDCATEFDRQTTAIMRQGYYAGQVNHLLASANQYLYLRGIAPAQQAAVVATVHDDEETLPFAAASNASSEGEVKEQQSQLSQNSATYSVLSDWLAASPQQTNQLLHNLHDQYWFYQRNIVTALKIIILIHATRDKPELYGAVLNCLPTLIQHARQHSVLKDNCIANSELSNVLEKQYKLMKDSELKPGEEESFTAEQVIALNQVETDLLHEYPRLLQDTQKINLASACRR